MSAASGRRAAFLAVAFALSSAAPATPGPLRPPVDDLRVWLVERTGFGAMPLPSRVQFLHKQRGWGALVVVGFRGRPGRPDLGQARWSTFAAGDADNPYPYAFAGPIGTPDCPDTRLCAWPDTMPSEWWLHGTMRIWPFSEPTALGFYVMAVNYEVEHIDPAPGWRVRRVSGRGASVRVTRGDGAAVRVPTVTTVQYVEEATLSTTGPSVAHATIPCSPAPFGQAVLHGGDPPSAQDEPFRHARCALGRAIGSGSGPTTWRLRGVAAGVRSTGISLVVATVPTGR